MLDNESGSSDGRQKNSDFIRKYGLYTRESQMELLLSICTDEFCHSVKSSDGRVLYVFCVKRTLYKSGSGPSTICVYVKHDCPNNSDAIDVVVSLHELEKPIELIFSE